MESKNILRVLSLLLTICMHGCSTAPVENNRGIEACRVPNAIPKSESRCKYGNPDSYCVEGHTYKVMKSAKGYCRTGLASWYGMKFHGQKTSSREPYDMFAMTAASPTLPIPTYVEVTNLENGKKIIVKVNDRGPFKSDRLIDLSFAAASKLGFANKGTTSVEVRAIDTEEFNNAHVPAEIVFADKQLELPEIQISLSALTKRKQSDKPVVLERFLQLGAFSQRDNAKRLQQQIAATTDAPVLIKEVVRADKTLYRVQIGPFKDSAEQETMMQKLKSEGFTVITVFG